MTHDRTVLQYVAGEEVDFNGLIHIWVVYINGYGKFSSKLTNKYEMDFTHIMKNEFLHISHHVNI